MRLRHGPGLPEVVGRIRLTFARPQAPDRDQDCDFRQRDGIRMVQNCRSEVFGFTPAALVQQKAYTSPGHEQTPVLQLVLDCVCQPVRKIAFDLNIVVEQDRQPAQIESNTRREIRQA